MNISVVLPCYNVSKYIETVIRNLPQDISNIIIVNDCSTDDTEQVINKLQSEFGNIIYLKHESNKGVGGAMITGFKKALQLNVDIVIKIDGDNQMDSLYIPALVKPIKEGKADVTKGNRFRDFRALRKMPLGRRIGNLGLSFCIKGASGYWNIFDPSNGFIAYSNETLKNMNFDKIHKRYFFESSMLIEMYYYNTVILDIPMIARYNDEISNLSVGRSLLEFPPKLFIAFIKRVLLKYFLFEFNIASVFILFGFPLLMTGLIFGIVKYIHYAGHNIPAPTGTVVIPTLLITLGFQLLLSAANFDVNNYPKK